MVFLLWMLFSLLDAKRWWSDHPYSHHPGKLSRLALGIMPRKAGLQIPGILSWIFSGASPPHQTVSWTEQSGSLVWLQVSKKRWNYLLTGLRGDPDQALYQTFCWQDYTGYLRMTNWGSQLICEGIPVCSLSCRYHLHFLFCWYAYFMLDSTETHIVLPYLFLQDDQEITKLFVSVMSPQNFLAFQS